MKLIKKSKEQIVFTAEMSESIANAIRRYLNHVPIAAIDELEISRNDSPLYDETIAHRIGLVPLKMEKGVENKKIKLSVQKDGMVYSGEMKGVEVVYKEIPITTLDKGQELDFTATLKIGTGSEHAKFSPGVMFYRNASEITMDKEFLEEIKRIAPDVELKEKGNKIVVLDNKKKGILDVCEGMANKKKKPIEIVPGNELVINVESFGQLDAKDIFEESLDVLKKDLSSLTKALDKA